VPNSHSAIEETSDRLTSTESGALSEASYGFGTRFEADQGTNPEELIAAAHAGCFSMALSSALTKAGHAPTSIETSAAVHLDLPPAITKIELTTTAEVPGIDESEFMKLAEDAKANCPVSKALSAVEITLSATLR